MQNCQMFKNTMTHCHVSKKEKGLEHWIKTAGKYKQWDPANMNKSFYACETVNQKESAAGEI